MRLSHELFPCGLLFRLIDAIAERVEDTLSFAGKAGGSVKIQPLVKTRLTLPDDTRWGCIQLQELFHC
jgi:hypothetical protein